MKSILIVFSVCWLMAIVYSTPISSTALEEEIYDMSPEESDNFFRYLLLSKYDSDSPEYPAADQEQNEEENEEDPPKSSEVKENPMEFETEEKLLPFDTDELPAGTDELLLGDSKLARLINPIRQAIQKYQEKHSVTKTPAAKIEKNAGYSTSTTSAPDVLASMPPVTPNKGQKEFVMLRPPSDNHRKIEQWMEEMANDLGIQVPHTVQKRRYAM